MKYRRILAACLAVLTIFTGATALAAGTAADPLLSLSQLESLFSQPMRVYAQTAAEGARATLDTKLLGLRDTAQAYAQQKAADVYSAALSDRVLAAVQELVRQQNLQAVQAGMERKELKKGDRITGLAGTCIMFVDGMGKVIGPAGSEIINITAGGVRKPGPNIKAGILYMTVADDGSGIEVTSEKAAVLVKEGVRPGYRAQYTAYADALKLLGLFLGSDKGYELDREPYRTESLIMLIRLLGEEQAALAGDDQTPFIDLNIFPLGKYYVAYAWRMGYTSGTSAVPGAQTFSPDDLTMLEQYLTFVLRALGYQDGPGKDFVWNTTSRDLALQLGLLTADELAAIDRDGFYRDHVVLISYRALFCRMKTTGGTLADRLCAAGVLDAKALELAAALVK